MTINELIADLVAKHEQWGNIPVTDISGREVTKTRLSYVDNEMELEIETK